jgi:hypothetical protein
MFNPAFNKPKVNSENSYALLIKSTIQLPTSDVEKDFSPSI